MNQDESLPSFEGTWARLSQVAVKGAEYNSRERQPHPKCLEGTRVDLLNYIHGLLDDPEKNRLIWLHGTAGVGKSAVAFTIAERMRGLKVAEQTNVEKRLAGTFFFSRKHTKRCMAGCFYATLAYQLASNFPSIREDVSRTIRDNPALLDPDKPVCDQMEALFLQPLRRLRFRLRGCPPLTFVVDALDECTSESELADLILSLAQALREPDLPVTHILLTSRSESHICKAFHNDEVRPLTCEIPVKTFGEGIATIISLDGADVDNDIYIFLQHSFGELQSRHPDFPHPSRDQLTRLAIRAGRRFIVASTMMKFIIDDGDNDPRDRLQLMLELTSELLPGTEVYKLYDRILSTCANPKRAYLHLSVVAALADPLPISQISTLLGPGLGRDVVTTLMQLRSVMNIPTDSALPVNIYHSSIRDYVSNPSNCSLPQVHDIISPHSLLAHSSLRLMMEEITKSTALFDALSELKRHSLIMKPEDPLRLKDSLAFLVRPPEPLSVLVGILWLRGDRGLDSRWLETLDGCAWLKTQGGEDWLQTQVGLDWLQTPGVRTWLETHGGRDWLQTEAGRDWLQTEGGRDWLQTEGGHDWLQTRGGRDWLQTAQGRLWLQTQGGRGWLHSLGGQDWLQTEGGRGWLQNPRGRDWLKTQGGQDWLQTHGGQNWLQTWEGRWWLQTSDGRDCSHNLRMRNWPLTPGERNLLLLLGITHQLVTLDEQEPPVLPCVTHPLLTPGVRDPLPLPPLQDLLLTLGSRDPLQTLGSRDWLQNEGGRAWLQTQCGQKWLQIPSGRDWLQTSRGRDWLQTLCGRDWLQTSDGQAWQSTAAASVWVTMEEFSSTLEAISKSTIVKEAPLLPASQVIQQFKTLPDFLMFPVFLALRHRDHATLVPPEGVTDMEIIHAMKAFERVADEAQGRSQSASDALKYACHNWAVHLSRTPDPWADTLNHIFQAFWNHHLIYWLETEWCLKGLGCCLVVLSEGQNLAKSYVFETVKS